MMNRSLDARGLAGHAIGCDSLAPHPDPNLLAYRTMHRRGSLQDDHGKQGEVGREDSCICHTIVIRKRSQNLHTAYSLHQ